MPRSRRSSTPHGTPLLYVTFDQASQRDWSTGTEKDSEHMVTLYVWSAAWGKKQAHEILAVSAPRCTIARSAL